MPSDSGVTEGVWDKGILHPFHENPDENVIVFHVNHGYNGWYSYYDTYKLEGNTHVVLELPASLTDEKITDTLEQFYNEHVKDYIVPFTWHNAFLNPFLHTDRHWMKFYESESNFLDDI